MFERDKREMPVVDSATPGVSPSAVPFSATASSRKEKKKQAKEERDRLKQAEKKKRRLEKALATAAAIRTELEKKKQRRKEEEQRLDEEGAALAEAVALQVLVDEESDGLGRLHVAKDGEIQSFRDGDDGVSSTGDKVSEDKSMSPCLGVRRRESVQQNGLKRHGSFNSSGDNDRSFERESKEWKRREWETPGDSLLINTRDDAGLDSELEDEEETTWDVFSSAEEKARTSNERARRAEVAAGLAAAQAVAALRIAEEARAEAEAAKKAAEEAMNEALDQSETVLKPESLDEKATTLCVEKERDELKARLLETERQLQAKTQRVSELEHNLEEVTQYLLEFKAMFEGGKHSSLTVSQTLDKDTGTSSDQEDATPAESSGGTVDE